MAKSGNSVKFKDDAKNVLVKCTFDDKFSGDGVMGLRVIKGEVRGYKESVGVSKCTLVK